MKRTSCILWSALLTTVCSLTQARAVPRTWNGSASSDWFDADNWVENAVPVAGDDVTIAAGTALLTNTTPALASLTLTGTLVFSNWNTTLSATNVAIGKDGVMTCAGPFTDTQMSNNVVVVCSNLTVEAGGWMDADAKGYAGGKSGHVNGYGPGGGRQYNGGGYGGFGGGYSYPYSIGTAYGSASGPEAPGSGGDGTRVGLGYGTPGGGAIAIEAGGDVIVNGWITANGQNGSGDYQGLGSGGAVWIRCRRFYGTNGVISVKGGGGGSSCGPGGGGRIAIGYDPVAQDALPPPEGVQFLASPGASSSFKNARAGTIHVPDTRFLGAVVTNISGNVSGFSSWETSSLIVSNVWLGFPDEGMALTVSGDIIVTGSSGWLELGGNEATYTNNRLFMCSSNAGPVVRCGGSFSLRDGASLALFSGLDTTAMPGWGALVDVAGDLIVASANSWIYPTAHPTNGTPVFFRAGAVRVEKAGAGFDATQRGYAGGLFLATEGMGPGAGRYAGGGYAAGYGGFGGGATGEVSGTSGTYGSAAAPEQPGSSGYCGANLGATAPNGGGAVRIDCAGPMLLNGTIQADGGRGPGYGSRASSGGGVYITCGTFCATNGVITARGGDGGDCFSGGGGRIAVVYDPAAQSNAPRPSVTLNAASGAPVVNYQRGDLGTLYLPDKQFLTEVLQHSGRIVIPGFARWNPAALTVVTNSWIAFRDEGFELDVANRLSVIGSGAMLELGGNRARFAATLRYSYSEIQGPTVTCGDLVVTNGGALCVYAGLGSGEGGAEHGALVSVSGDIRIADVSWIYPASHPTNGASVHFLAENLYVPGTSGGFNANELGYAGGNGAVPHKEGWGPGAGIYNAGYYGGGGYGGYGGGYAAGAGGGTYGSSNAPVNPGSGGCGHGNYGKAGGGLIRIEARRDMLVNGRLLANGGTRTGWGGSGSGGGIYLTCRRFLGGADGLLSARGGNMGELAGSGGGGGRIAVWRRRDLSDPAHPIPADVAPGTGTGTEGSLVWGTLPSPGTTLLVR